MADTYAARVSRQVRLPNSPYPRATIRTDQQMDPIVAAQRNYDAAMRAHQLNPSEINEQALQDAEDRFYETFRANVIKNPPLLKTGQGFDPDG